MDYKVTVTSEDIVKVGEGDIKIDDRRSAIAPGLQHEGRTKPRSYRNHPHPEDNQ
jgi:hypothetical protein